MRDIFQDFGVWIAELEPFQQDNYQHCPLQPVKFFFNHLSRQPMPRGYGFLLLGSKKAGEFGGSRRPDCFLKSRFLAGRVGHIKKGGRDDPVACCLKRMDCLGRIDLPAKALPDRFFCCKSSLRPLGENHDLIDGTVPVKLGRKLQED